MNESPTEKTKLPYEKPCLEVIELKAEEVLAVGCKTASGSNVGAPVSCGSLQPGGGCVQVGS